MSARAKSISDTIEKTKQMSGFKRNSVLIVDDEQGIRSFLQKGLEKVFGLVEVAENVEEAEALRQRCNFDLIIFIFFTIPISNYYTSTIING